MGCPKLSSVPLPLPLPPASDPGLPSSFGVAISNFQRWDYLWKVLKRWIDTRDTMGIDFPIVVVDDGSPQTSEVTKLLVSSDVIGVHLRRNRGVAAVKNRCIEELMKLGCEHLFLADNDVHPLRPDWFHPYITHDQPHLCYTYGKSRLDKVDFERNLEVYTHPRGVLMYVRREVIDSIGGMRPEFARWGHEHVEWQMRIHNAGWTAYPYQGPLGLGVTSKKAKAGYWHCRDQRLALETGDQWARRRSGYFRESGLTENSRREYSRRNAHVLRQFAGFTGFVEYRGVR